LHIVSRIAFTAQMLGLPFTKTLESFFLRDTHGARRMTNRLLDLAEFCKQFGGKCGAGSEGNWLKGD
jgi:hypothetical protein